jgi:hypothetical protein
LEAATSWPAVGTISILGRTSIGSLREYECTGTGIPCVLPLVMKILEEKKSHAIFQDEVITDCVRTV